MVFTSAAEPIQIWGTFTLEERFLRDLTHKDILSASFQNAGRGTNIPIDPRRAYGTTNPDY